MSDKTYTPETITDQELPGENIVANTSVSQSTTGGNFSTSKIQDTTTPKKRVAVELLSSSLNTKSKRILAEYQFTESGALQIGKYENGVSGDLRISPAGIIGRNIAGNVTFAIDAETGNAVFAGEIQSGSLITGQVIVGNNSVIIDGENKQIIINDGSTDRILIGLDPGGF